MRLIVTDFIRKLTSTRIRIAAGGVRPDRRALRHLLNVSDIPNGAWRVLDERTWRTGSRDNDSEWAKNARASGSTTAWRSFQDADSDRWVWLQVTPFASPADAIAAMEYIPNGLVKNRRTRGSAFVETAVDGVEVPGASRVWAREMRSSGPAGESFTWLLVVSRGGTVVVAGASGSPTAWTWPAVVDLVVKQLEFSGSKDTTDE